MFNKETFRNVLITARGNRTNEDYSKDSSVSRAYISNYINLKRDTPPTPEIIKKLALCAHNNVSYEDLMKVAGYLENEPGLVGKRLIYLREQKGLSQEEVAKAVDIDIEEYKLFELNHRLPDYDTLQKFANFYGVSVDFIISFDDLRPIKDSNLVCEECSTYHVKDKETQSIMKEISNRDDLKALINATKGATKEDIEKAIKIIETLKGN